MQSANFELFTTAGERRGREAIRYFEQVRQLFIDISPNVRTSELPVRIIGFRSEKEWQPYAINEVAVAFYFGSRNRDYIVMKTLSPEEFPLAVHEYTHLIIRHSGINLPIWLNEGLADLYSSVRTTGGKTLVGELLPGRFQVLQRDKWIGLDQVMDADHNSPYYNEKNRAGIFYAESWALTHMLYLSPDYSAKKLDFLKALASGTRSVTAFQQVYGKTAADVQRDLNYYVRGNRFYAAVFNVKMEKSAEDPEIRPASELESGLVLAELLTNMRRFDAARDMYNKLATDSPKSPEPEEGLATIAIGAHQFDEAKKHFDRAAELGDANPQFYYEYARLMHHNGAGDSAIVPLLEKAVQLKPDYTDARLQLGFLYLNTRKDTEALEQFHAIKKIGPERASDLFRGRAYAEMRTGDLAAAKTDAERAKQYAKTPQEISGADDLIRVLDRRPVEPPPAPPSSESVRAPRPEPATGDERPRLARREAPRSEMSEGFLDNSPFKRPETVSVEGRLIQMDCLGRQARMRIRVGQKTLSFLIDDPAKVNIKSGGAMTREFECGPQKSLPVVVEYVPRADPNHGTMGTVFSIEFK